MDKYFVPFAAFIIIPHFTPKSWDLEEKIDRAEGTWDTSWDEEE